MLAKYLVISVLLFWLGGTTSALQCWFCYRTANEFPLLLRDNCRPQTCPPGTSCFVEINKGEFYFLLLDWNQNVLRIVQWFKICYFVYLQQTDPSAVAAPKKIVVDRQRLTVVSAANEICATLSRRSSLNTNLTPYHGNQNEKNRMMISNKIDEISN